MEEMFIFLIEVYFSTGLSTDRVHYGAAGLVENVFNKFMVGTCTGDYQKIKKMEIKALEQTDVGSCTSDSGRVNQNGKRRRALPQRWSYHFFSLYFFSSVSCYFKLLFLLWLFFYFNVLLFILLHSFSSVLPST